MNPRTSQKRRKEILVSEGGAFLAPLLAPLLGILMGPLLKSITGGQMAECSLLKWKVGIELTETAFKHCFME